MSHLRALLMVLIAVRLLMPPGICACKWQSPAARLLIALLQSNRQLPLEQERDSDDDHDAGCPASPLSAGMGVVPPSQPHLPPQLALEPPPLLQASFALFWASTVETSSFLVASTSSPLFLTVCALLL